jgi:hypothetical protein
MIAGNKTATRRLMQLYFMEGKQDEALRIDERTHSWLASELRARPAPETIALAEQLRHEQPVRTTRQHNASSLSLDAPLLGSNKPVCSPRRVLSTLSSIRAYQPADPGTSSLSKGAYACTTNADFTAEESGFLACQRATSTTRAATRNRVTPLADPLNTRAYFLVASAGKPPETEKTRDVRQRVRREEQRIIGVEFVSFCIERMPGKGKLNRATW